MLPVKVKDSLPQVAYLAETVRDNEAIFAQKLAITMPQLMEQAGLSAFKLLQQRYTNAKTILIVCGSGNNAGDGFVLGRYALANGYQVLLHAVQPINTYQGDALAAATHFIENGGQLCFIEDIEFQQVDVIVDALLGTGFRGKVRDNYLTLIDLLNTLMTPTLSLDVPSGLDANCGVPRDYAVKADATVTFVAIKQGLLTGMAADYCGELYVAHLGVGQLMAQQLTADAAIIQNINLPPLPKRPRASHKGDSGMVLALGSERLTPGAIIMAATAALRAGAGYVAIDCHQQNQLIAALTHAEFLFTDVSQPSPRDDALLAKLGAIIIGPGLGVGDFAKVRWQYALAQPVSKVVDADALTLLAQHPCKRHDWILTPHPKEAARLLGGSVEQINADRITSAKLISHKYGGICVLKGAGTIVTDGRQVYINSVGNPGMAVAGMGDVLAGIIGALLLQSSSLLDAALNAVYIHAKAADNAAVNGEKGLLPSDLYPFIRQLVNQY